MTKQLKAALKKQKKSTQQETLKISGSLGIPLGGQRLVEVPNRNSFVYVKLRDNQNEVIQAFNNKVAPSYGLPVIVERQHNRYVVLDVDTIRYQSDWTSFAPYLPRHGNTHSFDTESGGGGDIVWVHNRQFMPALIIPSGTLGAPNVLMSGYSLKNLDGTWKYVGNTGTQSLAPYKPVTGTQAVMVLVYLDTVSGNPYLMVGSGSYFLQSITGSAQILPYVPTITNTNHIPLSAIRLVTGTSAIGWGNIYDVRQFYYNLTGSGGGGGSDSTYLRLDTTNDPLTGELQIIPTPSGTNGQFIKTVGNATPLAIQQIGSNTVTKPALSVYRGSGTSSPEFDAYAIEINEDITSATNIQGGFLRHVINGVETVKFNPRAPQTAIQYLFNTTSFLTTSGSARIMSVQNDTTEVFGVGSWGIGVEGYIQFNPATPKEVNSARMGYEMFSSGFLEIVGVGTAPNRWTKVYDNFRADSLLQTNTLQVVGVSNRSTWPFLDATGTAVPPINAPLITSITGSDYLLGVRAVDTQSSIFTATTLAGAVVYTDVLGTFLDSVQVSATGTFSSCPYKPTANAITNSIPWPEGGILSNLSFRKSSTQPASGSLVVTLLINNVATALTVTVAAGSAGASTHDDNTHQVSISAGDLVRWSFQNNATSASSAMTSITMKLNKRATA